MGDNEGRLQTLKKICKLDPTAIKDTIILANQYEELGYIDEAEETYRYAISIKPGVYLGYQSYASFLSSKKNTRGYWSY